MVVVQYKKESNSIKGTNSWLECDIVAFEWKMAFGHRIYSVRS